MKETICLNGQWGLLRDPEAAGVENASRNVFGWLPAQVPGNIQKDLENAHELPRLWYGEVDHRIYAAAMSDWWYRREFTVPASWQGKRLTLDFEGVDYGCEIYLNGQKIGSHQGMFERFWFDVQEAVRYGETNTLLVKIDRMPEELLDYHMKSDGAFSGVGTEYFFVNGNIKTRNVLQGLKSPANLSYDWGTNLYTLGIWKDVTLRCTENARIDWLYAKPTFRDHDTSRSTVEFLVEANAKEACETDLTVSLTGHGLDLTQTQRVSLTAGDNRLVLSLDVENPELWMPFGYGGQPLYEASATLGTSDSKTHRIAFRDIWWTDCEGAPENFEFKYQLVMNGQKIRVMGSNLTAMDLLFGTIGDRAVHFVELARRCNMNTLRLHGGQIVYPHEMYDAADELGIMLSSEFPVGNCCLENDEKLMAALDVTYHNIIRQLRNHPSIVEWTGGNELEWYFKPNEDRTAMYRQEKAVYEMDDSRLFRPTCPVPGSRHAPWTYDPDVHYDLYNDDIPDNFKTGPCMRFGEFGAQTPSNLETWYRDVPEASRWPINENDPVLIRKNAVKSVFGPQMWLGKHLIDRLFGEPDDLEDMVKAGQFIGAEGLRYCFDALRAKGKKMGGFTNWDFNEPWPNCAGSYVVDYDGRPVMAYEFAREALEPVTLSLKYDSLFYQIYRDTYAELRLVSDSPAEHKNLRWSYTCFDRTGAVYDSDEGTVDAVYMEAVSIKNIRLNPPELMTFGPVFVYLKLQDEQGTIVAERVHVFACQGIEEPLRGLLGEKSYSDSIYTGTSVLSGIYGGNVKPTAIRAKLREIKAAEDGETAVIEVENTGSIMALFIEVRPKLEYQSKLLIDHNFVSIPVGESRTITVTASKGYETLLSLSQVGFLISGFNAPEVTLEPDESVLLYVGRKDEVNREFKQEAVENQVIEAASPCVDASRIGYLLKDRLQITFPCRKPAAATLVLVLTDHEASGLCKLKAAVNGCSKTFALRDSLGVQDKEPWHLAYPKTLTLDLPADVLRQGENTLELEISNGFAAWDFLCIKEK